MSSYEKFMGIYILCIYIHPPPFALKTDDINHITIPYGQYIRTTTRGNRAKSRILLWTSMP